MRSFLCILGCTAALGGAIWLLTGASSGAGNGKTMVWKPLLPEDEALKLAKRSVAIIQESVAELTKKRKTPLNKTQIYTIRKRIQANAGLLPLYAKSAKAGADKQHLITLAVGGLQLHQAALDRTVQPAALAKLADKLTKAKVDARAKLNSIKWEDYFEDVSPHLQGAVREGVTTVLCRF